ncbi:hypothetical protein O1611_g7762 [Lasiodiplodia mahajangana]|uniref:Uncharacterized protein n=1 Tax=Lasiodiplodia mahajangana TaxID=1108764 RepID=A0ACC2JEJ5_9PEZI|nr:hypothetical protein O1611_g7762 [Lasiodiplodia mahajangana]
MFGIGTESQGEGESTLAVRSIPQRNNRAPLRVDTRAYDATALIRAVEDRNLARVRLLLNEAIPRGMRNTYVAARDNEGRTALHYAVSWATPEVKEYNLIDLLIEYAADRNACVTATDNHGLTVLHMASKAAQDVKAVSQLINEATDKIGYITAKSSAGTTALHQAAQNYPVNVEVMRLLINEAVDKNEYVTMTDNLGRTALHVAARATRDAKAVSWLIEEATDKIGYINARDHEGKTALHLAARVGSLETVKLLVTVLGNSRDCINAQSASGATPLHEAVCSKAADIVFFLLTPDADRKLKDNNGNSAWDLACLPEYESWEVIATFLLKELGVKDNPVISPHLALFNWHDEHEVTTGNNMIPVYQRLVVIAANLLRAKNTQRRTSYTNLSSSTYLQLVKVFVGILRQIRQEFHENQEALPHLRSREPSCAVQALNYSKSASRGSKLFVSLVMPFIDVRRWEIIEKREAEYEKQSLKYCVGKTRNLVEYHMPTTLDEYCSPALSKGALSLRNKDQVLKRYETFIREKQNATQTLFSDDNHDDPTLFGELKILIGSYMKRQQSTKTTTEEIPPPENVVLVRQSWIWIIDNDVIITQPPEWGQGSNSELRKLLSKALSGQDTKSIALFLGRLVESLDNPVQGAEGSLLKIYENALLFISEEVNHYTKSALVEDIDLDLEKSLFHKINDLREELSMIKSVIAEQEEVWNEFMSLMWPNEGPDDQPGHYSKTRDIEDLLSVSSRGFEGGKSVEESERFRQLWRPRAKFSKYKRRIEKLEQDAERVERNISTKLDLKQKHATIREAHSTAVLSATVFGFTIITVIFAPLSFIVALFALPLDTFNEGKNGDQNGVYSSHYIGKWSGKYN